MDEDKYQGYSKCVQEFMKQMEEQRIKPALPKKPILKVEKPIPAPRKYRESYSGSRASNDICTVPQGTNSRKGPPPIKLKRSKTFSTTEKPRTHQKEEDLAPVGEEQETNPIKNFTKSEIHYLETLKIIIPVFMMGLQRRSVLETNINMEVVECLVNRLIDEQTKFVLDDLDLAETCEEVLHCFSRNKDLFYTYRGFFLHKCSLFTFPITRPKTNFKSEVNLRQFLNDRIAVYKRFIQSANLESFNCNEDKEKVLNLLNFVTMDVNVNLDISKPPKIVYDIDRFFVGQKIPEAFFKQPSTITKYGRYQMRNKFKVYLDSGITTLCVHLFTKIMLFTKESKNGYLYQFHLNMDEIGYSPARNTKNIVEITHYFKTRPLLTYRLEGHSNDVDNWKLSIESILQEQQNQAKEINRQ